MRQPGRIFSAEQIYENVWEEEAVNTDTIMVHIRKLRKKIEADPRNPEYIKVVWGIGYKIEKYIYGVIYRYDYGYELDCCKSL